MYNCWKKGEFNCNKYKSKEKQNTGKGIEKIQKIFSCEEDIFQI